MRVKKKHIRESISAKASDNIEDVKDAIELTKGDLEGMGVDEPGELAAEFVSDAMSDDEDLDESVRPKMTKDQLIEAVKNSGTVKTSRRVIKTLKIKDLRNE